MPQPIAVISGDIHYNLNTMLVADGGVRMAIAKANELGVPFISNGDMLDTKANMRAEYVNAIIETFKIAKIKPYINVGNHSRINEKAPAHALNFMSPYAHVIDTPTLVPEIESWIVPYAHDPEELRAWLVTIPAPESRLIMHQGVRSALAGDYIQDKSALDTEDLADFRAILSHYHRRQDIKCGRPRKNGVGLASYIGNLFTLNYGEANDPPKGFQILMSDGSLEFVPTNLRKHIVWDFDVAEARKDCKDEFPKPGDLLWIKLRGTREQLSLHTKERIATMFDLKEPFRLDLIPTDNITKAPEAKKSLSNEATLDAMIDSVTGSSDEQKERLKQIWKGEAQG